jgi:uncharacterized protein
MRALHYTALTLAIVGAINWGLVGLFDFDLVAAIFGGQEVTASRVIYTLVGVAGLTLLFTSFMPEARALPHRHRTAGTHA